MTAETESPKKFWYWAGLTAISAVSKHLYLDKYIYQLYPNIYVMLVGKSGIRKGPPISMAKRVVEGLDITRTISGRNSIQSILQETGKAKTFKDGRMLVDASAFIVSDEMSNIIIDDPQSQTILTQLYDSGYHESWKSSTKYGGVDELKNPYFVMLGGTAPVHISEFIHERSITGGFIGRTMVIFEEHRNMLNSLTEPPEVRLDVAKLQCHLKRILKLKGEFKYTDEGKKAYNNWYYPFNENLEQGSEDTTGTADRLPDHVLKVAMLLSLSSRDDLLLTTEDIEDAIELCTNFTTSVRRVSMGKGKSEYGLKTAIVIEELLKQSDLTMERSKLLQRRYGDLDAYDLDRTLETLVQSDMIEIVNTPGKEAKYRLKEKIAEYFRSSLKMKSRNKKEGN